MRTTIFLALWVSMFLAFPSAAQQNENNARGFQPEKAYQFGDIDHVNLFNGNLIVTLPIGARYRLSEALTWGLTLVYNGNPWNVHVHDSPTGEATPSRFANAGLGWQLTLGELVGPHDSQAVALDKDGNWVYATSDGAERPFYAALHEEEEGTPYAAADNPGDGGVAGYTRDGTYLRLIRKGLRLVRTDRPSPDDPTIINVYEAEYAIEFPDGTVHTFRSTEEFEAEIDDPSVAEYEKSLRYRLTRIADRYGNRVDISYGTLAWTITERLVNAATPVRTHTVTLSSQEFEEFGGTSQSRGVVTAVRLAAFDGKTVEYSFGYNGPMTVSRPCFDGTHFTDPTTRTLFLQSVTAREGSTTSPSTKPVLLRWTFEHVGLVKDSEQQDVCSHAAGHLKKMTVPTGGIYEYTVGLRTFPSEKFGQTGRGDGPTLPEISTAISERRLTDINGVVARWTYAAHNRTFGTYSTGTGGATTPRELAVVVTDPLQRSTVHYFNSYRLNATDTCLTGGTRKDYGLPFTRTAGTGVGDLFLSTESYDQRCFFDRFAAVNGCPTSTPCRNSAGGTITPIRRTYVRYAVDTWAGEDLTVDSKHRDHNARVVSSRTSYVDDTGCDGECYVESSFDPSSFDGLGHFRTAASSSNFPLSTQRTTTTAYDANTASGTYVPADAPPQPSTYMIPPASPWLLDLHSRVTTSEGSRSLTSEACFDRTTGFLLRTRTWAGADAGVTDLLAVYSNSSTAPGNVGTEAYSGGDAAPLAANFATCTESAPVPTYSLSHTHDNGARETTQYSGVTFKSFDATVDASGVASSVRDTAEVPTTFVYDAVGRVTEARPTGRAWTQYTYSVGAPSSVIARTFPAGVQANSSPLTERRFYFDGFGRPTWNVEAVPEGWIGVNTLYDSLGQKASVSMPEFVVTPAPYGSVQPSFWTNYTYDSLGRPTSIMAPEGGTNYGYTGARIRTRTSFVATSATAETDVSVTEHYDGAARLVEVRENSAADGAAVTTRYAYDPAGRLISVTTEDQSQQSPRSFAYDGRGVLTNETHPENGTTTYSGHDARGHAGYRVRNGRTLKFKRDSAERLTDVYEVVSGVDKPLKAFVFGTVNAANDLVLGKLVSARRVNELSNSGRIDVTETYTYAPPAGDVSRRKTLVERVNGTTRTTLQEFSYGVAYDDLGLVKTLTMPTCSFYGCSTSSGLTSVGYTRNRGYLTAVDNFAALTYHPSGMVKKVEHQSSPVVRDEYSESTGMGRPSAIRFSGGSCPVPSASPISAPETVCASSTANTASITAKSGVTHTWSISPGGTITSASTGDQIMFTAPVSGTVTLTVVATDACDGMAAASKPIGVTARPSSPVIAVPETVLSQSTGNHASVTPRTGIVHTWSIVNGTITSGTSGDAITFTASTSGTVTVTVTATGTCGTAAASVQVAVLPRPPAAVLATTQQNRTIAVSWTPVTGAASYRIERSARVGESAGFVVDVTATSYVDTVPANSAPVTYIYYVRTIDATNAISPRGPWDHAVGASVLYAQPQLVAGQTAVRASDLNELRQAIDSFRYAVVLGPAFGGAFLTAGEPVRANDLTALVAALNGARAAIGTPSFAYNGVPAPVAGSIVYAAHVQQIREALR